MANIRNYGLRGPKGDVLVVDEDRSDKNGDPVPIVALKYDLETRRVTWLRNRLAVEREDVRWEETDWRGADKELMGNGDPAGVKDLRAVYVDLFKRFADVGLIDSKWIDVL
jgi:hypothetical protein